MKHTTVFLGPSLPASVLVAAVLLGACGPAAIDVPPPVFDTGADTSRWATIPAGEFLQGQHEEVASIDYDYEMMVFPVTHGDYAAYLGEALEAGAVKVTDNTIAGPYPGDEFRAARHEVRIDPGEYLHVPLIDTALRLAFDGVSFTVAPGWDGHPMTSVTWFGARAFCEHYGWRLPTEWEWEKAARGPLDGPEANRPFPWGSEITRANANYYASRDPFEKMSSYGSRTSPVGFYNGRSYDGYVTLDSPSPYGLYDMAGNVWQWTADVHPFEHYRYLRGGSKDTYDMDLRIWVRNSATPTYFSPGVGFRCAR
jgi:formylglycine-generating enzyme required for sulfatase activity